MAELTIADVKAFAANRPMGTDAEIQRMLDAALMVARREAHWHVSPVKLDHVVELDGPGSRILWLPTLRLATPRNISVEEDETMLSLDDLRISVGDGPDELRRIALRKRNNGCWSSDYGSIIVTMDHGFTEAEAADWRQAILSMVDQMSLLPVKAATGSSDFGATAKRIDDVSLNWNPYAAMAEEVMFSISSIIAKYRLAPLEFL